MASWGLWIAYGWPLGVSGCTVIQMGHESTTQPLARPFAHTAHSFVFSTLLALLTYSAAHICSLAHSLPCLWESG